MPTTNQVIKLHRRRLVRFRKKTLQHWGLILALFLSIGFLFAGYGLVNFYSTITTGLPSYEHLITLLDPNDGLLMQPTRFYDRTGEHVIRTLQNPSIEERTYLHVSSQQNETDYRQTFSDNLIFATISISDPTFWNSPGFSLRGINENKHNTIAQRLVSDLLLWEEPPDVDRAFRERILAAQITSHFGREQVMEWYLNSANYGSLTYGADNAARLYFGKSASNLTLKEAAILAGVSESPALNPFSSPDTARNRGTIVIDAMEGQGLITAADAETARNSQVTFLEPGSNQDILALEFIQMVWFQLSKSIPIERVERGGFRITTSLDIDLQTQARCTTKTHLTRLAEPQPDHTDNQVLPQNFISCPASKYLPTISPEENIHLEDLYTNVVIYDPFSGQVLALISEKGENNSPTTTDGHPPGTLFTPFVYLTALTRGFSPSSLLWDIPPESTQIPLDLLNPTGEYQGPLRLRDALATDALVPAAQLINQVGANNTVKIARQMGLSSLSLGPIIDASAGCFGCQLLLNEGQVTLVEAVQAYGVFNNQGYLVGIPSSSFIGDEPQRISPVTVLSVVDNLDQIWQSDPEITHQPVISPQLAYLMTDMLSDEASRWPLLNHPNPLEIGRPVGAKIGSTFAQKDAWTVGYTPQLVVGVWQGTVEESDGSQISPTAASVLWHAIMKYTVQDLPSTTWSFPQGISEVDVCDPSGMLPTPHCPSIVNELFLEGREPTQIDNLYKVYQVNRETQRLATVFTPPDLIEERIYLNIPPEAIPWAESIGLEIPPITYDPITSPNNYPNASIISPNTFAFLSGLVNINGQADGHGFISYRIQIGEGINPTGWVVVKEETSSPVTSGRLGTWDTRGLNGLYAIQLVVLRENQRVETVTTQVTLDNQPPQVEITYPNNMDTLLVERKKTVTFMIHADDNLGLNRVEYYLDNKLLTTQYKPPFAYPWESSPGTKKLSVRVIDHAGNTTETDITFFVE